MDQNVVVEKAIWKPIISQPNIKIKEQGQGRGFSPQKIPSRQDILEQGRVGGGVAVADCSGWEVRGDKG